MTKEREIVLQKLDGQSLLCLDDALLSSLPAQFVAYIKPKGMTDKQRGALHLWCDMVATALNDNNLFYEYKHAITGVIIETLWDMALVKRHIYKPTLKSLKGKVSTEDQSRIEPSDISSAIQRAFVMHKGINLPDWPSAR